MFSSIGLPGALAYVVAGAEVLGGIGLLVPRFTRLATMGLILVMVGAVSMHATKIPGGLANGVPALVYASHLNDPADGGERPQKSLIIFYMSSTAFPASYLRKFQLASPRSFSIKQASC